MVSAGLLSLMIVIKDWYNRQSELIDLPDRFEHTLYRVVIAFLVIECIRMIILVTYRPQNPRRRKDNFTIGVSHVSRILYGLFVGLLVLSMFNISVKEAITSLSLIAAAIVLITKDYIANLINGMYLTFNKVVNVGDQVKIGSHKGKIMDITLTNVHLLNDDDDIIYIPNNNVFSSEIINYTRRELKKSSIDFEIDPMVVSDLDWLEKRLIQCLDSFSGDIQSGTYNLRTVSVKKESVQLKFQYILNEPLNKELDKKIRKHFIHSLVQILHEESGVSPGI